MNRCGAVADAPSRRGTLLTTPAEALLVRDVHERRAAWDPDAALGQQNHVPDGIECARNGIWFTGMQPTGSPSRWRSVLARSATPSRQVDPHGHALPWPRRHRYAAASSTRVSASYRTRTGTCRAGAGRERLGCYKSARVGWATVKKINNFWQKHL